MDAGDDGSSTSESSNQDEKCGVHLEVRWFYRKKELPGNADKIVADSETLEEIVESDHVDDIEAVSLLSSANLHSSLTRPSASQFCIGMPVVDFFCRRFFSVVRRSLLPCGSLHGRVTRGKSHSKYIREDAVLRELIGAATSDSARKSEVEPVQREDAFLKTINKLLLTDASKESSESIMIGREKEQNKIMNFLKSAIRGGTNEKGSSMFVAGPPGVGKTGCIRPSIAKLQRAQASGIIPPFRFISLNGMEMRHPFEAFIRFLEALKGGLKVRKSQDEAVSALEQYFTKGVKEEDKDKERDIVTVLLLDEIDYLYTQDQKVLYNFFDWPRRSTIEGDPSRRLVVIGVSNTMTLPDRLQPRIQSRIGDRRCCFKAYSSTEIQSILKSKIEQASPNLKVFEEDAIRFASVKTAAVCGDVRRAFQLCRRAAELVLQRIKTDAATNSQTGPLVVGVRDVNTAGHEASDSGEVKAVAHSTPFEVLLLVSLASLGRSTGRGSKGFDVEEIVTKMEALSGGLGEEQYTPPPRLEETLLMLNRLAEAMIVQLDTPTNASLSYCVTPAGMGGAWPIASLLVAEHNLYMALRNTRHNALVQKYLSKSAF